MSPIDPGAEAARSDRWRDVVTPEGVAVRFRVASISERAGALVIDMLIVCGLVFFVSVANSLLYWSGSGLGSAFGTILLFLIWNFYFVWFEGRRLGVTPGKKALRLRVIDRHGGPLTPYAVFARNLTRNAELLLPIALWTGQDVFQGAAPTWVAFLSLAWIGIFAALPLFNRDRLRLGDVIGGTLVVHAPHVTLSPDVAASRGGGSGGARYAFSAAQLDVYGVYELQVLEQLLRDRSLDRGRKLRTIADKIANKIGFDAAGREFDARRFLGDFYRAQRRHHEAELVLGKRREFKRESSNGARGPRSR